jgi:hypothetical protein
VGSFRAQEKKLELEENEGRLQQMNEEEARAAREYLNRLSAGQDEKIAALKEQLAELQAEHGAFTLEKAEERLEKLTQNDGIGRRARERGISFDAAFDELAREAYEPWVRQRRRQQELEKRSAERSLAIELGQDGEEQPAPSTPRLIETEAEEIEHLRQPSEGV